MAKQVGTLEVRSRRQWHAWLTKHHASSSGVWLVYYKPHTGVRSVSYEESVLEALCVGWVDSLIKRLDDDRYVRKFTARKPTSKWSDSNRRRWAQLQAAGQLATAGLAAAPTANKYAARRTIPELPAYVAKALKANAEAWRVFQSLPPSHRRQYVGWIHSAKRPDTRERRLVAAIEILASGRKLGLK